MLLRHLLETHLLSLAHTAPRPPQVWVCDEQVVLSVQSAVVRHRPPFAFSKHRPPLHLPDKHWLFAVHVVPGQEAIQTPGLPVEPLQLPLWHWLLAVQGVVLPYGITQMPPRQSPVAH